MRRHQHAGQVAGGRRGEGAGHDHQLPEARRARRRLVVADPLDEPGGVEHASPIDVAQRPHRIGRDAALEGPFPESLLLRTGQPVAADGRVGGQAAQQHPGVVGLAGQRCGRRPAGVGARHRRIQRAEALEPQTGLGNPGAGREAVLGGGQRLDEIEEHHQPPAVAGEELPHERGGPRHRLADELFPQRRQVSGRTHLHAGVAHGDGRRVGREQRRGFAVERPDQVRGGFEEAAGGVVEGQPAMPQQQRPWVAQHLGEQPAQRDLALEDHLGPDRRPERQRQRFGGHLDHHRLPGAEARGHAGDVEAHRAERRLHVAPAPPVVEPHRQLPAALQHARADGFDGVAETVAGRAVGGLRQRQRRRW